MKILRSILLALLGVAPAAALGQAIVWFPFTYFNGQPMALREGALYPISNVGTNAGIVMNDRIKFTTDTNGCFWATNVMPGTYWTIVSGSYQNTTNQYVFPSTNGIIDARKYSQPISTNLYAFIMASYWGLELPASSLYGTVPIMLAGDGSGLTNLNVYGTNIINGTVSSNVADVGYVFAANANASFAGNGGGLSNLVANSIGVTNNQYLPGIPVGNAQGFTNQSASGMTGTVTNNVTAPTVTASNIYASLLFTTNAADGVITINNASSNAVIVLAASSNTVSAGTFIGTNFIGNGVNLTNVGTTQTNISWIAITNLQSAQIPYTTITNAPWGNSGFVGGIMCFHTTSGTNFCLLHL